MKSTEFSNTLQHRTKLNLIKRTKETSGTPSLHGTFYCNFQRCKMGSNQSKQIIWSHLLHLQIGNKNSLLKNHRSVLQAMLHLIDSAVQYKAERQSCYETYYSCYNSLAEPKIISRGMSGIHISNTNALHEACSTRMSYGQWH